MNLFFVALSTVAVMLLYALPGFFMIKTKLVGESGIKGFVMLLMYLCSPMQSVDSLRKATFSSNMAFNLVFVFGMMVLLNSGMLLLFHWFFKKKREDVRYRIYTLATCFGNCGFMGIPILNALMPDYPEAAALSTVFSLSMNVVGWTLGSFIISGDRKYMSMKKIFLNPAMFGLLVGLPFFIFGWSLPTQLNGMVELLGKMTAPLCMLIMGMRLAGSSFKSLLGCPIQYGIIAVKQILFPLVGLGLLSLLPIDPNVRIAMYIMLCCPVASVVLNFAELIGKGQETAANLMLLGTGLSVITIPLMVLFI